MRTPKVYLETTIFNFYFADDAPDKRQDTIRLFEEIGHGKYEPYTSEYVLAELANASEPKRGQMAGLIKQYNITILPTDTETSRLAALYVAEGVIPVKYGTDALHVATTAVNNIDFIVSYNFRHIVKRKTVVMSGAINMREGYRQIGIFTPTEVIEYE